MKKFKVEPVKDESGLVIGIRAARVNDRDVIIALRDVPQLLTWDDSVKCNIPSNAEWLAILENKDKVNKLLEKMDGEPLKEDWYWSSSKYKSEYGYVYIISPSSSSLFGIYESSNIRSRCKM